MKGATRTRIMYSAYLSYSQLREYLDFLETKGLLKQDEEMNIYKLTDKGLHFLNIYDEVKDLFAIDARVAGDQRANPQREPISIFA